MSSAFASNTAIRDHYLEIQALSAVDSNLPPENTTTTNQATFFFPIFFIIILFIGVFGWQFYTRLKDLNRILMILVIGLIVGMVPLTVNVLNSRSTNSATKASIDFTPQTVIVADVASTSFRITWRTQVPTLGAVKLSTSRDMRSDLVILRDPQKLLVHSHALNQLKPGTVYYIQLFSDSVWYQQNNQPIMVVTAR
jgi:hypothetical protein